MLDHPGRSVLKLDYTSLADKISSFKKLAGTNPLVLRSAKNMRKFLMGLYSYASLHIALAGNNRRAALHYFFKALSSDLSLLGKKRCYAILSHLL